MTTLGIGTQNRGMLIAAPRIVSKPITDRVESNEAITNRVEYGDAENRVATSNPGQRRLDIAA